VLHDTTFAINLGTIADCAVVLFTAQTACKGASSDDTCYIRALDNGAQMRPAATNGAIFDSESQTPSAHSLAWVSRGPLSGTHHFILLWGRVVAMARHRQEQECHKIDRWVRSPDKPPLGRTYQIQLSAPTLSSRRTSGCGAALHGLCGAILPTLADHWKRSLDR
jgi:hypothetical protein